MGDFEAPASADVESTLEYHPGDIGSLTCGFETSQGTMAVGQFDWGGRLQKGNGGVQRSPQYGWKPCDECKGIRWLNCETDRSSRYESRA